MAWPVNVANEVFVKCGRHCCICHSFSGTKMEMHHIFEKAKGGLDTADNCIPLCFDCHADVGHYNASHPKGKKYTADELKGHRDNWYQKVSSGGGITTKTEFLTLDKELFSRIQNILPKDGSIYFLRHNNFAGFSFLLDKLDDLYNFEHECVDPNFEFLDPELEAIRGKLQKNIDAFTNEIGTSTFPTQMPGRNTVPQEWEREQPERFDNVVNKLHNLSANICDNYDKLVKTARRRLN